jgi:hypothetical protein
MAMSKECFSIDFCIGSAYDKIFAVATGTTISCSLGKHYGPVFSLSSLGVYAGRTLLPAFHCLASL